MMESQLLNVAESANTAWARTAAIYNATRKELGRMQLTCPAHGPFLADGMAVSRRYPTDAAQRREYWEPCPQCVELARIRRELANAAWKRDCEEKAAQEREWQIQENIRHAGVPQRFIGKAFDDFVVETDGQRKALAVARDYVERFSKHRELGSTLILAGRPGTGKSLLSMIVLQELCRRGMSVRYVTCQGLVHAIRRTWGKEGEGRESDVIDDLSNVLLLVVDEIGVQAGTENEKGLLYEILDRRYSEMRPTILATNLDKTNFKAFVGERVMDRMAEIAKWVPFGWDSYRPRARREMADT